MPSGISNINFPIGNIGDAGTVGLHNLLSAEHTDTVTGSGQRGYIIAGNLSGLWEKLDAKNTRAFLVGDGTDLISRIIELADIPEIPKSKISTTGTWLTSELPSSIIYNNQNNGLNGFYLSGIGSIRSNSLPISTIGFIRMQYDQGFYWRDLNNLIDIGVRVDVNKKIVVEWDGVSEYVFSETQADFKGNAIINATLTKSEITDFAHTHVKADITDFAHTHTITDSLKIPNLLEILANETVYAGISNSITSLDENEVRILISESCTMTALKTNLLTNGITANTIITVRKNGIDTALSVTYASGETGSKSDTDSITLVDGDIITIKIVGGATGTTINNLIISIVNTKVST